MSLPLTERFPSIPLPLALVEPGAVWWVEAGHADLFLVERGPGGHEGARRPVDRLDPGALCLPVDPQAWGGPTQLLLVGVPGTRVRQLPLTALLASARQSGGPAWLAAGLAQGLRALNPPPDRSPGGLVEIDPGEPLVELSEGQAIGGRGGLQWVEVLEGELRYQDDPDLPTLPAGSLFPLCGEGWVGAVARARLRLLSPSAVLDRPDAERWLLAAAGFLGRALRGRLLARERGDAGRLQERLRHDAQAVDESLRHLAGIVGPSAAERRPPSGDPLLDACNLVGRHLDLMFVPHPHGRTPGYLRDPLGHIARASRVRLRNVTLQGDWWQADHGPLLVRFEQDQRPAAVSLVAGRYMLEDPSTGEVLPVDAALNERLSAGAVQFYRPFGRGALTLRRLMAFGSHGVRRDLGQVLLMGVLGGLLGMVTPMAAGMLFDSVIPSADKGQLVQLSLALFGTAIGAAMFELTRSIALLRIEGRMNVSIQAAAWDRLLSLPVPFFRRFPAADLALRVEGISTIRQVLSGTATRAILTAVFSLFNLALLFYYSAVLALVGLALVAIAMAVTVVITLAKLRLERQLAGGAGLLSSLSYALLNGVAKLRMAGAEPRAFGRWSRLFARQRKATFRAEAVGGVLETFNAMFPLAASMAIFVTLAFFMKGQVTPGQFLAFNAAFGSLMMAMLQMSGAVVAVLQVVPLFERVRPVLQAVPEADAIKADPGPLRGEIEISHLSFSYRPEGPQILRDVSLNLRAGQFVAIVGPSGSGKSTLLRCLLGFEAPSSGAIFYDGQDLSALDITAIRRQLGVVLQNGQMLSGNIFQNIVGASSGLTLDDAWHAARLCGLEQDIRDMPMGMHTVVAGGGLSGGQRQRLLIARAIARRPRILFFDEATSALDNRTQAQVGASLEQLEATRVVVAHRLSTVRHADLIVVLDEGAVKEQGTYEELMAAGGLFAQLARRQLA